MSETSAKRQAASEGRDAQGRFTKGNKGGPGNPFARKVAELRKALVNFVTEDDMKHVAFILKERAMGGNLEAIKLLFQYVLGNPAETIDPDRLDVDEWEKMQEKSRPPTEMQQVMGGLPADTVCDLTKIAWPCALETAFRQPLLDGFRKMDEEDARRAAAGSEDPRQAPKAAEQAARSGDPRQAPGGGSGGVGRPAPSAGDPRRAPAPEAQAAGVKSDARAEESPSANGSDGLEYEPWWFQECVRAAEMEKAARLAREAREGGPSTNGRNGTGKRQSSP